MLYKACESQYFTPSLYIPAYGARSHATAEDSRCSMNQMIDCVDSYKQPSLSHIQLIELNYL